MILADGAQSTLEVLTMLCWVFKYFTILGSSVPSQKMVRISQRGGLKVASASMKKKLWRAASKGDYLRELSSISARKRKVQEARTNSRCTKSKCLTFWSYSLYCNMVHHPS